jgi:predicted site-specific integrase-resolvase
MDANLKSGMAESHSRSVETPAFAGIHQPKIDVASIYLLHDRGNGDVCPERIAFKGYHDRVKAVFLISRSPELKLSKHPGGLVFLTTLNVNKMGVIMFEAKAVIYTRLNSESEYDLFKKHTEVCEEYALENDFYVFDVFSDYPQHKGLGRPGLSELLCTLGRERNMKVLINDFKTLSDDRIHLAHLQTMIEMLDGELLIIDQQR